MIKYRNRKQNQSSKTCLVFFYNFISLGIKNIYENILTTEFAKTKITMLKNTGEAIVLTELLLSFFLLHKLPLQQSKLSGLKC